MNKHLAIGLLSLTLVVCACAGTPFKWNDARRITQGMTTADVKALIGSPTSVTARDGLLIYVWVYVSSISGSKTLRVDFKDDKVITAPPIPDEFKD